MKRTVRLTESELIRMISESVRKVLNEGRRNYHRSYEPNDGNGMTGGYYGSYNTTGSFDIYDKFIDNIITQMGDTEETQNFVEYCGNSGVFDISAEICVEFDESTGYGSEDSPVYTIEKIGNISNIKKYIMECPSVGEDFKRKALTVLEDTIDSLDAYDFDIDDEY